MRFLSLPPPAQTTILCMYNFSEWLTHVLISPCHHCTRFASKPTDTFNHLPAPCSFCKVQAPKQIPSRGEEAQSPGLICCRCSTPQHPAPPAQCVRITQRWIARNTSPPPQPQLNLHSSPQRFHTHWQIPVPSSRISLMHLLPHPSLAHPLVHVRATCISAATSA
jgi:hypothetical protein